MTADERRASSEQCQNNYSFFYMCCRYCLHATCQYCARNHRHCFVHRFSETNPPIRVWSTGKLNSYVQLAEDVDRCWCVSGGGHTELARLAPCLCTVNGFLGSATDISLISLWWLWSDFSLWSLNSNWIPDGIPGRSQMGKEGELPGLTENMFHYGCCFIYFQRW